LTKKVPPVVFAPSDGVDAYASLSEEFVREILALPWAMISDASCLSDFCGCGLDDRDDLQGLDDVAFNAFWDKWIVERVCERYRIEAFAVTIRMVDLFARIERVAPTQ
jgi:hypothetical protein